MKTDLKHALKSKDGTLSESKSSSSKMKSGLLSKSSSSDDVGDEDDDVSFTIQPATCLNVLISFTLQMA